MVNKRPWLASAGICIAEWTFWVSVRGKSPLSGPEAIGLCALVTV